MLRGTCHRSAPAHTGKSPAPLAAPTAGLGPKDDETWQGPDGREVSRGVNSIDLYFDGARWWIASVVWQSESARYPIPAELLPPKTIGP
jgi:hypothetical protein